MWKNKRTGTLWKLATLTKEHVVIEAVKSGKKRRMEQVEFLRFYERVR